jgi:hypothetical protein
MSVKSSNTRSTGAFTSVETFTFAIVNPPAVDRADVDPMVGNSIIRMQSCTGEVVRARNVEINYRCENAGDRRSDGCPTRFCLDIKV